MIISGWEIGLRDMTQSEDWFVALGSSALPGGTKIGARYWTLRRARRARRRVAWERPVSMPLFWTLRRVP